MSKKSLGWRVVKDLTRNIVGKFHTVYFNNCFTSVNLMISLKEDQILACESVHANRVGLTKKQKLEREIVQGDMEYRTSYTGIRWLK